MTLGKATPIVAQTAGALDLKWAECISAGIGDVIPKPVIASTFHGWNLDALRSSGR